MVPDVRRRNSKAHGATLTLLKGHEGCMSLVAFVSDDHIISASDQDRTIRQWTFSDGHWRNEVLKEAMAVCAVATSPDRRWVAYGGIDGRVRLIDLETRKITKSDDRHTDMVQSVAFSPDSNQLASGARDGTMLLWSLNPLQPVAEPSKRHNDSVWCIRYSPDGGKIASCDRQVIQIRDGATRAKLAITEQAWSLAWSTTSEGCFLLAGCIDGTLRRFDASTGATLTICKAHRDVIFSIALPHNANFIATASWDKTVRFWEAATFQEINPCLQHEVNVHSISISSNNNYLVSGARDSIVRVWNLQALVPMLFCPIPLQPLRAQQKSGFLRHVHFAADRHPTEPHLSNAESRIASKSSQESLQKNDGGSAEDKSPLTRLNIPKLLRKRSKGNMVGGLRTPSPSSQESNAPDSPAEVRCSPVSYHSTERSNFLSPGEPSRIASATIQSPSPTSYVSDSENADLIRKIRSHPSNLSGKIIPEGNDPVSGGSHGDIYRGTLNIDGSTIRVAVKVIKKYTAQGDDQSKKRRLRREITLWRTLEHRNVIPLLGTSSDYGAFEAMVCPWVENGALTTYLDNRKDELTEQQRFAIINDVALGLQYLHSRDIVHGDISGTNVLIHESGRACIADFGLSVVLTDLRGSSMALTYQVKGTLRYTAPELFGILEPGLDSDSTNANDDACKIFPTVQSDIYSFGGIMLQTLSGKIPYHYLVDGQVILAISKGEYPRRPKSSCVVTDAQWDFMIKCWSFEAMDRPLDAHMVTFVHEQLLNVVAATSPHYESSPSRRRRETGRSDEELQLQ